MKLIGYEELLCKLIYMYVSRYFENPYMLHAFESFVAFSILLYRQTKENKPTMALSP